MIHPVFLAALLPMALLGLWTMTSAIQGIYALYKAYPPDAGDAPGKTFYWATVEFGGFRGHAPMTIVLGRRALHLKEPFPIQPLFWLGPASVPWEEIRQTIRLRTGFLSLLTHAELELGGPDGRRIRIRGRAARAIQEHLDARAGIYPPIRP
jgi:hypothetical protein